MQIAGKQLLLGTLDQAAVRKQHHVVGGKG